LLLRHSGGRRLAVRLARTTAAAGLHFLHRLAFEAECRRQHRGIDRIVVRRSRSFDRRSFDAIAIVVVPATRVAAGTIAILAGLAPAAIAILARLIAARFLRLDTVAAAIAVAAVPIAVIAAIPVTGVPITVIPITVIAGVPNITVVAIAFAVGLTVGIAIAVTIVAAMALRLLARRVAHVEIVAVTVAVELVILFRLLRLITALIAVLLLEARAGLAQHPEIVIGELEIIFGVDPIALHLGVARQILVFLQQLRRIAARAIVDAIATTLIGIASLRALSATAAATTVVVCLTIIHQGDTVLSKPSISPTPDAYNSKRRAGISPARRACHGRRTAAARMTMDWAQPITSLISKAW